VTPSAETLAALGARLAALAEAEPDREICGLVEAGPDGALEVRPLANLAADPARAFALDPRDVLAALRRAAGADGGGGTRLCAVYHSHPRGGDGLSGRDLAEALCDGRPVLPGVAQVVVSLRRGRTGRVTWHRWDGGRYRAVARWPAGARLPGTTRHHR
jgi:proteasome lid subunit RPN8/RPN11